LAGITTREQRTSLELELSGQTSSKTTETYAIIIKLDRKNLKKQLNSLSTLHLDKFILTNDWKVRIGVIHLLEGNQSLTIMHFIPNAQMVCAP
jgi:hypothetical protein